MVGFIYTPGALLPTSLYRKLLFLQTPFNIAWICFTSGKFLTALFQSIQTNEWSYKQTQQFLNILHHLTEVITSCGFKKRQMNIIN
jgi:hypothetical protein